MVWTEIDVDRRLTDSEVQVAAGKTFGIAAERVRVVADLASDIVAIDPAISLIVEHRPQPGDFPERMAFVMWDGNLIDMIDENETSPASYRLLTALASHLDASIIAPADGMDPYTGLLIEPSGDVYQVRFDEDVLDDLGGVSLSDTSPRIPVPELSPLPQRRLQTS